jgi:ABC-2 type transport system ATP-binding protein
MTEASAVVFEGVSKGFGSLKALNDISFSIPKGSFFGLLGPNGAGKSTLIGALSGLVTPDSGQIRLMGEVVSPRNPHARQLLGLVPQELINEPFFSIQDLLRFQAGYFGLGKAQWVWIDHLLNRLNLWEKRHANLSQLSGGMKRRVLIALALVHKPPVLVLDEPTAGVDIELRLGLWDFVRELHAEGHTIILTTHYLEEAETLCEQIAILRDGQLLTQQKTADLLLSHPWEFVEVRVNHLPSLLPETVQSRVHRQQANLLTLRLARASDERLHLTQWFAEAGVSITELRSVEASLEDVFRSLTTEKSV